MNPLMFTVSTDGCISSFPLFILFFHLTLIVLAEIFNDGQRL